MHTVTTAEFASHMANFHPLPPALAVAVSGGADSMALCLLAQGWASFNNITMTVLTVDHALRPESAAEALQVSEWMRARNLPHHILSWKHTPEISGNLQAAARNARYRLMTDWCKANGAGALLVAHHQDDQAETFLLRLARGSGVDGLSAMAAQSMRDDIAILRPLLDIPKTHLVATLEAMNQPWIEDPSNSDASFDRVKFRQAQAALNRLGLTASRLSETATAMGRVRRALEALTERHLEQCVAWEENAARFDLPRLLAAEEEIVLRALAALLRRVGGNAYNPRLEELERLHVHLQNPNARAVTLARCLLRPLHKPEQKGFWQVQKEKEHDKAV